MRYLKGFRLFESDDNEEWSEEEVMGILENPEEAKNPFLGTDPKNSSITAFSLLVRMSEVLGDNMSKKQFLNLIKYLINIDDIKLASYMLQCAKEIFDNINEPEYKKIEYIFDKHYYPNHFYDMYASKMEQGVYSNGETEKDIEDYINGIDNKPKYSKKLTGRELQAAIDFELERVTSGDKSAKDNLRILSDMLPESLRNKYKKIISI